MNNQKRMPFATNSFERRILGVVFVSTLIPIILVMGFFYILLHDLIDAYLRIDLARHFLQQFIILSLIVLAYYFVLVAVISYRFVHRLFGAYPRILKELDQVLAGLSKRRISLREGDYGRELIKRVNTLIERLR